MVIQRPRGHDLDAAPTDPTDQSWPSLDVTKGKGVKGSVSGSEAGAP